MTTAGNDGAYDIMQQPEGKPGWIDESKYTSCILGVKYYLRITQPGNQIQFCPELDRDFIGGTRTAGMQDGNRKQIARNRHIA
jgi:hypothetical protein